MIEVFKICHGIYDREVTERLLCFREDNHTRGHCFKLFKKRARLEIRKHSFVYRIEDIWNSQPESVVESPSIKIFENHLDKHWKKLPIKYEYLAQPNPIHTLKHYVQSNDELALEV